MQYCSECGFEGVSDTQLCPGCSAPLEQGAGAATSKSSSENTVEGVETRSVPRFIKFIFVFFIALGWYSLMSAAWTYFTG